MSCGRSGCSPATCIPGHFDIREARNAVPHSATELSPVALRSLDALHLATALSVRDDIGVMLTYDRRLAEAAQDQGLRVAAPRI